MSERHSQRPLDATEPQLVGPRNFSWSGIFKSSIVGQYAPILAHAVQNQWTRTAMEPRPGNTSRRIQWRNSLWSQRFWCPSSRQPALARLPSLTMSRSRPRSMSSRCRPKGNITDIPSGQGAGPAPKPPQGITPDRSTAALSQAPNLLWSIPGASDNLRQWRELPVRAHLLSGVDAVTQDPAYCCYRRNSCPNSPLLPSSVQRSSSLAAPARRLRPSLSWCSPSWSNRSASRASKDRLAPGRADTPDPAQSRCAASHRGRSC